MPQNSILQPGELQFALICSLCHTALDQEGECACPAGQPCRPVRLAFAHEAGATASGRPLHYFADPEDDPYYQLPTAAYEPKPNIWSNTSFLYQLVKADGQDFFHPKPADASQPWLDQATHHIPVTAEHQITQEFGDTPFHQAFKDYGLPEPFHFAPRLIAGPGPSLIWKPDDQLAELIHSYQETSTLPTPITIVLRPNPKDANAGIAALQSATAQPPKQD